MAKTKKKVAAEVKKAVAKKPEKKEPQFDPQAMIKSLQDQVDFLFKNSDKLNARIDRLVAALSTAKRIQKDM